MTFQTDDSVRVETRTPDDDIRPIIGQTVTVIGLLTETETGSHADDTGPMYAVRDANGTRFHVFEDELTLATT